MIALGLGLVWLGLAAAAAVALRLIKLRRLSAVVPVVVAALAVALASHVGSWSGPLAGADQAGILSLGRVPIGLLIVAALSVAWITAMAPAGEVGDPLATAVVGAASIAILAATDPLVWACALLAGTAAMALRWIMAAPSRASLAAPRVAGLGAACALAITPFSPVPGQTPGLWPSLVSWLLAATLCALLALLPLGGWAVASLRAVHPSDAVLWQALLAPAVLLTATRLPGALPATTRGVVTGVLLFGGLASALWGSLWACASRREDRYWRVYLSDIGLACAAIGAVGQDATTPVLLILLCHLTSAPVVLAEPTRRWMWTRRCGWLAASGLPPSISFWARLLVLEACAGAGRVAFLGCFATLICLILAAVTAIAEPAEPPLGSVRNSLPARLLMASAAVAAIAVGLAPQFTLHTVFGPF